MIEIKNQAGLITANLDWFIPIIITILFYTIKACIDKELGGRDVIRTIVDLPVEGTFLASSLVTASLLRSPEDAIIATPGLLIYLLVAIFMVIIHRRSLKAYYKLTREYPTRKLHKVAAIVTPSFFTFLNYTVAFELLHESVLLLKGRSEWIHYLTLQ